MATPTKTALSAETLLPGGGGRAPVFVLEVAGKRIGMAKSFAASIGASSRTARVTQFEFDEKEKQGAECKFTVTARLEEADTIIPQKGDKVRVRWGYLGALSELHNMVVHSVDPKYGAEFSVEVMCRDQGDGLGDKVKVKVYRDTRIGDVVTDLAAEVGLKAVLPKETAAKGKGKDGKDTTAKVYPVGTTSDLQALGIGDWQSENIHRWQRNYLEAPSTEEAKLLKTKVSLVQNGRSPIAILRYLAERTRCDMRVSGGKLIFKPLPTASPPEMVFVYRSRNSTLKEFSVKSGKGNKDQQAAKGAKVDGVDPVTKKALEFTAKEDGRLAGKTVLGKNLPWGLTSQDAAANQAAVSNFGFPTVGSKADYLLPNGEPTQSPTGVRAVSSKKGEQVVWPVSQTAQTKASKDLDGFGVLLAEPSGKQAEAEKSGKAAHTEASKNGVKASATVMGFPTLRRTSIIEIRGVSKRDAGKYMVKDCTHKIGKDGYTCSLQLERHGTNDAKKNTKARVNESAPSDPNKGKIRYAQIFTTDRGKAKRGDVAATLYR